VFLAEIRKGIWIASLSLPLRASEAGEKALFSIYFSQVYKEGRSCLEPNGDI